MINSNNNINFVESNIEIFYQNCNGLVSKRVEFINSSLSNIFDIFVFQETNFHSIDHKLYCNFDACNLQVVSLSSTDSGKWCRGMLMAYNAAKLPHPITIDLPDACNDFDIRCHAFDFFHKRLNILSIYRSPSMTSNDCNDFFDLVQEVALTLKGLIFICGDLNVYGPRKFVAGLTEASLLDRLF